eukprot:SAG31_NODE_29_length_32663_cov_14.779695_20_plen_92_part_00
MSQELLVMSEFQTGAESAFSKDTLIVEGLLTFRSSNKYLSTTSDCRSQCACNPRFCRCLEGPLGAWCVDDHNLAYNGADHVMLHLWVVFVQ